MTSEKSEGPIQDRMSISEKPPAQASTAVAQAATAKDERRKKELIEKFASQFEINPQLASRIGILEDYELVILCDDSGSMNTPIHGTNTNRWDELRQMVYTIAEIYVAFDSNGIDVYFLK